MIKEKHSSQFHPTHDLFGFGVVVGALKMRRIMLDELFGSISTPIFAPFQFESHHPVTSSDQGIDIDLNSMKKGMFYITEYEGEKYVIRLTDEGYVETYELEE